MVEEQQKELEEEDSSAVQDEVSIIELRQRKAGIKHLLKLGAPCWYP